MLFITWGFVYVQVPIGHLGLPVYVDSGVPPLSLCREEVSVRFIAKSLTSKSNPNYKYVKAPLDCASNKPRLPKPLEVQLERDCRKCGYIDLTNFRGWISQISSLVYTSY